MRPVFHGDLCWDRSCSSHMYRRSFMSSTALKFDSTAIPTIGRYTRFFGQHRNPISTGHRIVAQHFNAGFGAAIFNPDKSNSVLFSTMLDLLKRDLLSFICVVGCPVAVSEGLNIFSVTLHSVLFFDDHVSEVLRVCNYHLRSLRFLHSAFYNWRHRQYTGLWYHCITRRQLQCATLRCIQQDY